MTDRATEGLCARCRHRRQVSSARGSHFVLCGLSRIDDRFPRYPRLPVLACDGFTTDGTTDDREDGRGDGPR